MILKKIHFVIDKTIKASKFKPKLNKLYKNYSIKKSNVIVVVGGDGFMLETLKKYQRFNKPFYGINRGSFGFLMNKFDINNLLKNISKAKIISISPLLMSVKTKRNKRIKEIAINDVSLFRQSKQTSSLEIKNKNKIIIKKLTSDGVLVSTPAGSTAYNLSVHGPILNLDSKKIAITPISPFRPRRWKGKVLPSSSIIKIKNLNPVKRPISVVADNKEVRNIKNVTITVNNHLNFKLLYDRNNSLSKKIKLEQLRKEIN